LEQNPNMAKAAAQTDRVDRMPSLGVEASPIDLDIEE
jgi:hypothetical protein